MMVDGIWKHSSLCKSSRPRKPETVDYRRLRSVATKSGVKSNVKPPLPSAILILDAHTFNDVALVGLINTVDSHMCSKRPRMKRKMFSSHSLPLGADTARA